MATKSKRIVISNFLAIACAALALAAGRALDTPAPAQSSRTTSGAGGVMTLPNGDVQYRGTSEPVAKVDVPASLRGILAEVNVKEGQAVKKNDQLAKLDDSLQRQRVEIARLDAEDMSEVRAAENQIAFAKNEYDSIVGRGSQSEVRTKELAYKNAQLALDVHKYHVIQAKGKLNVEEITLKLMTLRSPIDGYVLTIKKQAGEQTDEGPVMTVVQTSRLNVSFFLPKHLFGKSKVGDKVTLDFEGMTKREGVVVAVDPTVDADLFRVKLEVDNTDAKIPAGISAYWTWPKQ